MKLSVVVRFCDFVFDIHLLSRLMILSVLLHGTIRELSKHKQIYLCKFPVE